MARKVSLLEVLNCGIACQPSQSKQALCIVSGKVLICKVFRRNTAFPYVCCLENQLVEGQPSVKEFNMKCIIEAAATVSKR